MLKQTLAIGFAAAGLVLSLASGAAPVESVKPAPLVQGAPRIIQIPEGSKAEPKADPKRRVEQPHKQPEAVKPAPSEAPAIPSLRAPVQTKSNRRIWI